MIVQAICALSARYSGFLAAFEPPVKFPTVDGSTGAGGEECKTFGLQDPLDMDSFGAKHMLWAREECEKEYARAERLLDVAIGLFLFYCPSPRGSSRLSDARLFFDWDHSQGHPDRVRLP